MGIIPIPVVVDALERAIVDTAAKTPIATLIKLKAAVTVAMTPRRKVVAAEPVSSMQYPASCDLKQDTAFRSSRYRLLFWFIVAFAVSVMGLSSMLCIAGSVAKDLDSTFYTETLRCGPNSLYIFLILSGYSNLSESNLLVPVSANGTSLLELAKAAQKLGIRTEIRHFNPREVQNMPMPALAQFRSGANSVATNHFCVLYKVDKTRVYVIDGTTGQRFSILLNRFPTFWYGYALVKRQSTIITWVLTILVIVNLGAVLFFIKVLACRKVDS